MSAFTREDVARIARLARLSLTGEEQDVFARQLADILAYADQVQEVATEGVPRTSHPLPLVNVFRPDVEQPCLSAEEALAAAPAVEDSRFRVPRILDGEA